MKNIGIVSGSFDPITNGHAWLIREAAGLVDELHVVMAVNPDKKYMFTSDTRIHLIKNVVGDLGLSIPVTVHSLGQVLMVDFATKLGANRIIRGLRNAEDLAYERNMANINRALAPDITTIYVSSPPSLSEISSSSVRSLLPIEGWERIVQPAVHLSVYEALRIKARR